MTRALFQDSFKWHITRLLGIAQEPKTTTNKQVCKQTQNQTNLATKQESNKEHADLRNV